MSVQAVFDFDAREAYRAARAVTRLTPLRYFSWVLAALAVCLFAWTVIPAWGKADTFSLLLSGLPYLVLAVFWLFLLPLSQRRATRKMPDRDASLRGPQAREIDAVGYHSRGNGVALDVPWHAMARGVETAEFFLFFYNKQCAYYLPKRTLSEAQAVEVRSLMHSALGQRARVMGATADLFRATG